MDCRRVAKVGLPALLILLGGCNPRRALSSGEIGCRPADIEISDRSLSGTWTAACNGAVYYCSATEGDTSCTQASDGASLTSGTEASAPASSNPTRPSAASQPSSEAADEATGEPSTMPAPTEALGYRFGSAVEDAEAACTSAGHEWTGGENGAKRFQCTGTPVDVGLPASSRLDFCDGKLCTLMASLKLDPERNDSTAKFQKIVDALEKKFGPPSSRKSEIPHACQGHIVRCAAQGRAKWKAAWDWADGEEVAAAMLVKEGEVSLVVRYRVSGMSELNTEAF